MSETVKYVDSKNIRIFPFAKYRTNVNDLGSRLFYENNVSRLIRQLTDTEGFIISGNISYDKDSRKIYTSSDSIFSLNIHGYYIEIDGNTELYEIKGEEDSIFAYITLTTSQTNPSGSVVSPPEIEGQDNASKFEAVKFDVEIPDGSIGIQIAEKIINGEDIIWRIPQNSYKKFDSNTIKITKIDGKH